MKHLSSLQLCAFLDDVLEGAPDDGTARHLATCAICRARYDAWCHVDDSLRELFGQDPDDHAMDQRTAWVEIAVTAERKGFPAPEFSELRIPLPPPEPSPPPVQVFPPGRAPRITPPAAAVPTPPREPIRRPVLQSPLLQPAPAPASRASTPSAPAPLADMSASRLPSRAPVAAAPASPPARAEAAGRAPGYARMPSPPRKGLLAFFSRPAVWLALALVAVLATALPLGIKRFGIPEITFGFHPAHEREADVKKAAADGTTDRGEDTEPAKKHKSAAHASATPEDPDASVLFDLPALEPEDGEPDPATTEPAPRHGAPSTARDVLARNGPLLCGEVRNAQGQPIEGARVYLTAPARMARTDRQGRFSIACPPGKRTIRIEATGRAPVTRTVQMGRDRLETRFTLNAVN